jgi:hypothetical protein
MARPSLALFVTAALAVVAVALVSGCSHDAPKVPASADEFMARLTAATRQSSAVFHPVAAATLVSPDGVEQPIYSHEAWMVTAADNARIEFRKDPTSNADLADYLLSIAKDGHVYTDEGDLRPSVIDFADRLGGCSGLQAPWVVLQLICDFGFLSPEATSFTVVPSSNFDGTGTFALESRWTIEPAPLSDPPPPAPPWSSRQPNRAKPTNVVYRFHVDRSTFLPFAGVMTVEQDGQMFGESVFRFTNDFVARDRLPPSFLDPSSVGYVPQATRDLATLDDPALPVPVYWLGRDFDPGGGLPLLRLSEVDSRSLTPGAGPGSALALHYESAGGTDRVWVDLWPVGAFERYREQVGGALIWASCSESHESAVAGGQLIVLAGHERPFGVPTAGAVRPGATPAPASPAAGGDGGCPANGFDRFMAEVHLQGVVVTLNAPLALIDQRGDLFGAFDTEAALKLVAAGLRMRRAGE